MINRSKRLSNHRRRICKITLGSFAVVFLTALIFPTRAYAAGFIEDSIKDLLFKSAAGFFNMYNGIIAEIGEEGILTAPFTSLLGSSVYSLTKTIHETAVVPVAESLLALFMLIQLIKISQRIDATATLPALKEIIFLAVVYVLLHWFILNSLDIAKAIYQLVVKDIIPVIDETGKSSSFIGEGLDTSNFNMEEVTLGGCFTTLIVALLSALSGIVAYIVAFIVSYARAWQIYAMAAFSSIPMALLGFDETRQMGVGFLKNFAAAVLAGAMMMFLLAAFPHILTSLTSQVGGNDIFKLFYGELQIDVLISIFQWIGCTFLLVFGLVKSGAWAKEVLGG